MLNRRRFLGHSCALGVTGATLGTTLGQLVLAREAVAQQAGDYRALVCIL
ncbi:MAG: twin-arginine translocation signal domain-containing protein, partial [Pseudomonadota bacterium]